MGPTGGDYEYGVGIQNDQYIHQFVGSRFYISQNTEITAIGGHIGGTGNIFGAIVKLSGINDFPNSFDLSTADVIAHKVFTPNYPGDDYRTPLETTVTPGYYALVFGSGLFGATGWAYMPQEGQSDIRTPSYIIINVASWFTSAPIQARFVVEGHVVPEPASALLIGAGLFFVRLRRKQS
jgi:hypothetical protein